MAQITNKQATDAKNIVIDKIMKAVADFQNNPEKVEAYIRSSITNLYAFALEYGRSSGLDELFNGDVEG